MVATNTSLTRLNIAKNGLGAHGFELLLPAMRYNIGLRSVSLAMNCRSTDAMLFVSRVIKSTRTLRKIDLRSNPLGDLGSQMIANALKANRSLTHLNIRNTSLDLQVCHTARCRWMPRIDAVPLTLGGVMAGAQVPEERHHVLQAMDRGLVLQSHRR